MKERSNVVPNQRLSDERIRRQWTQTYVARQIGAYAFMVHRWEHGQNFPGPRYRQKLLQLFQKSAEELGLVPRDTDNGATDTPRGVLATLPQDAIPGSAGLTEPLYDPMIPSSLVSPAGLVGREDLLHKLKKRLYASEHVALSALNGLPGVGKTALAVELVHDREVRAHFHDGVLWAGLGTTPNVAGLLGRWGALLGVTPEHANIEGWQKAITAAIGERRMLLVIDDAWEIGDALAFSVGGPNCAHLVTTRFPVIAHRFSQGETIEVHELDEDAGLRLLERLAPEAVRSEPREARALVRSIGGLPLALNLIGKHLYIQSYSGQPRRLHVALQGLRSADQRLRLTQPQAPAFMYSGRRPDAPLSLQSVISVSDQRLGEAARLALRALSVFPAKPNTFSMEAALAVCHTPGETIATLIEAGLLEQSDADRYTLHQTIADYARLHHTGTSARERMTAYYVSLVEAHELDYGVLELETTNVLAALQAAFELGMQAALLRGTNAFSHFLQTRGMFDIAERQLKRAGQVARSGNDMSGLITTLLNLGGLAERRGDNSTAQACYLEGLLLARESGNSERQCDSLTYLGGIAVRRGELNQAAEYSQEALVLSEQSGYYKHSVTLMRSLGSSAFFQGNYADAEAYWQKALALARQQNHPERISALLENLGAIAVNRGDYEQAKEIYYEAITLARQIGQSERISSIFANLSEIALRQKDYAQVKEYVQKGLPIARQIGHLEIISLLLINLGEAEIGLEDSRQAGDYLEEGLELAQQVGHPWLICYALLAWGKLYFGLQRLELAATIFREALEMARGANEEQVGLALYYLAQVTFAQGNTEEARQLGQQSLDIFNELGHENAKEVEEWLQKESI